MTIKLPYLSDSKVTNISKSFTHKMAEKTNWRIYGTKLRHCYPVYSSSWLRCTSIWCICLSPLRFCLICWVTYVGGQNVTLNTDLSFKQDRYTMRALPRFQPTSVAEHRLEQLLYDRSITDKPGPRYRVPLTRVDDLPGRRTLRSTYPNRLVVPPVKLSTVGSRAFAVPHVWNTLPTDVVVASSLSTFRRMLNRFYSSSHILYRRHPASSSCSGCTT